MSQLIGTWVAGDSGKELQYYVTQGGVALDVTGATNIVLSLVRKSGGSDTSVVISGAILSPASGGGFTWAGANAVGLYVAQPSSRQDVHIYEARVSFTLSGLVYWTDSFRIAVTLWGLSTVPSAAAGLDSGLSLQDAVDALGSSGGRIDLGSGTYYSDPASPTTPLVVPGGVYFHGHGPDATIIGSPILVTGAHTGFEDLCARAPGAAYGIKIFSSGSFLSRCFFRRVTVGASYHGAGDGPVDGIQFDGAGVLLAQQLTAAFCTGNGLLADSTVANFPNTTLKFDTCSFVKNGLYGVSLAQSLTIAEFQGGNMENNGSGELLASSAAGVSLLDVDFERGDSQDPPPSINNVVEMQNCNMVSINGCNFVKTSGATRAFLLAGCSGGGIGSGSPNRFEGWGAVGVGRISETCRNIHRGVNHIFNGSGWLEDYSR
jgi:hypothetical protein